MIGLKRGTVKLVPHNPKWAKLFEKEKQLLKKTFEKSEKRGRITFKREKRNK